MDIVFLVLGLTVGFAIGFLVVRAQKTSLDAKFNALSDEMTRLKEENAAQKSELGSVAKEKQEFATRCEVLASQSENWQKEKKTILSHNEELLAAQEKRHNESMRSMRETFNETIEHLKTNLKAATEDMLKLRQEEFTDTNRKSMQSIVSPLNETIDKMRSAMEGYSKEQNEFSGSMKTSIETIIRQTETARQSAVELTTALKHDSKVQGDYGEVILSEILSKQGLTEGVHYDLQYTFRDESGKEMKGDDGKGMRPDVILHLDTKRDVIVDSKVNLTDFINFANAGTSEERQMYLDKHVRSIENQVKLLSQKEYHKHHDKTRTRMDYVIMFVPISAAWWEALRHKPSLWRDSMESGVYIVDEQTLFAALRIINLTWTQIKQAQSQQQIFETATEMIDRVGQFMKSYMSIGDALGKAQDAFEKGKQKLTPGGQSIITTTNKLIKLGVPDSKKNPVSGLIDVDDVEKLPAANEVDDNVD